jgi:hypothetical protein
MTLVNSDLYLALRAANVPEDLAQRAAAIGGTRTARWERWRPALAAMGLGVAAIALGLGLGWLITAAVPGATFGPASVRCFSNGQLIYEGRSDGAVDRGWGGIAFRDAAGRRTRIRGDCVIVYDGGTPPG